MNIGTKLNFVPLIISNKKEYACNKKELPKKKKKIEKKNQTTSQCQIDRLKTIRPISLTPRSWPSPSSAIAIGD